mmetsp:Transcript_32569/g.74415  ORF Transcript_32569/g.74415 Transcript_32569/m.74415 type:complete len:217 (+) Transcript_32569:567-1217(+)
MESCFDSSCNLDQDPGSAQAARTKKDNEIVAQSNMLLQLTKVTEQLRVQEDWLCKEFLVATVILRQQSLNLLPDERCFCPCFTFVVGQEDEVLIGPMNAAGQCLHHGLCLLLADVVNVHVHVFVQAWSEEVVDGVVPAALRQHRDGPLGATSREMLANRATTTAEAMEAAPGAKFLVLGKEAESVQDLMKVGAIHRHDCACFLTDHSHSSAQALIN